MAQTSLADRKRASIEKINNWLNSCTRRNNISRNTISIGIVVLDHLKRGSDHNLHEVISPGGEISGARSGLGNILEEYGIPRKYLKEVTTRQGHQDGQKLFDEYNWGGFFEGCSDNERNEIVIETIEDFKRICHFVAETTEFKT